MFMRLIHRLCHFMIYATLFLSKQVWYKYDRLRNTICWFAIYVLARFQDDQEILAARCVTGNLLGEKKLTHAAVIVNELHKETNLPSQEQISKIVDVILWLMSSLDKGTNEVP